MRDAAEQLCPDAALDATGCWQGIHALNGAGNRPTARRWLRAALAAAQGNGPVAADLRHAAAAALDVAGPGTAA